MWEDADAWSSLADESEPSWMPSFDSPELSGNWFEGEDTWFNPQWMQPTSPSPMPTNPYDGNMAPEEQMWRAQAENMYAGPVVKLPQGTTASDIEAEAMGLANPIMGGLGALIARKYPGMNQTILRLARDPANMPEILATIHDVGKGVAEVGSLSQPSAALKKFSLADSRTLGAEVVDWLKKQGYDLLKFTPSPGEFAGKTSSAAARTRLFEHGLGLGRGDKIGNEYYYRLNPFK